MLGVTAASDDALVPLSGCDVLHDTQLHEWQTEAVHSAAIPLDDGEIADVGTVAGALPLVWMGEVFRKHVPDVVAVAGWKTRGRPYTFTPHGVVNHHTASNRSSGDAPALNTVVHGRPGIPGPLCNVLVARSGRVLLVAAGYANHAGLGGPWGDIPRDSGNRYAVGIEFENDGIGEPWTDRQLMVGAKLNAIIIERFRRGRRYCFEHKEWAPGRKPDRARIDGDAWRDRVRRVRENLFPVDYDYIVNGERFTILDAALSRVEIRLDKGKRVRARRVRSRRVRTR